MQLPDGTKAPVDRNDFSFRLGGEKVVFDFVYITIHGTPGEDGRLQGYLDMLHIPYSCCGVLAAALTYDKFACNQYLKAFGVRIADSLLLRQGQSVSDEDVIGKIGLPCFIKPSLGGSSFGVTKVKTREEIQPAIEKAFKKDQCKVYRNGLVTVIDVDDVVVGDKVLLQSGDKVPADGVLIHGTLRVDNSALNGEAEECPKTAADESFPLPEDITGDTFVDAHSLFRGAVLFDGEGVLDVRKVGLATMMGKMAEEMQDDEPDSPLTGYYHFILLLSGKLKSPRE